VIALKILGIWLLAGMGVAFLHHLIRGPRPGEE
jgi:hypothetical protein